MDTDFTAWTVRVNDQEAEVIRKAAEVEKRSIASFLLLAGLERAAALAAKG